MKKIFNLVAIDTDSDASKYLITKESEDAKTFNFPSSLNISNLLWPISKELNLTCKNALKDKDDVNEKQYTNNSVDIQ